MLSLLIIWNLQKLSQTMIDRIICFIILVWIGNGHIPVQAQRSFVHPGITYTQGDLDRMKAMVAARQEPYYSTFLKLKESPYTGLSEAISSLV